MSYNKKLAMTGFDIITLLREIKPILSSKIIDNVYITEDNIFLFKLNPGGHTLLFEPEKRLHLTKFKFKTPAKPPQLCMELRKHVRGCRIKSIRENSLERIVYIELESKTRSNTLILEIFKRGNLMLINNKQKITLSSHYAKMKDRKITRGETYHEMPPSGIHPLKAKANDILEAGEETLMKAMLKTLPLPPLYIQECLERTGLEGKEKTADIKEEDVEKILDTVKSTYLDHQSQKLKPTIIFNKDDTPINVVPLPLQKYQESKKALYESFNEALDDYFSKYYMKEIEGAFEESIEKEEKRIQRIINQQEREQVKLEEQIKECIETGKTIQENAEKIEETLKKLRDNLEIRRKDVAVNGVTKLDLKDKRALLTLGEKSYWLRIKDSAFKNAGTYFVKAKRLKEKRKGLKTSLEKTREQLRETKFKNIEKQRQKPTLEVKRTRQWYEKFRWFHSSEDSLILAGRDANTNRQLIEHYTDEGDIIMHAEVHGAPFVLIKKKGEEIGEATLREAAVAAVSYSRAWSESLAAADAYWVRPEQLSKKPPSGEYLPRGSYMIYGKRNYIRGVELRLAVGLITNELPKIIGGPVEAVNKLTKYYVEIAPGNIKSGRLAKIIIEKLKPMTPEKFRPKLEALSLDEIQSFIPSGKGSIIK